jgi:septal ring factor EnvC (AmiA/AmiB activator)
MAGTNSQQRNNQQLLGAAVMTAEVARQPIPVAAPLPARNKELKGEEHWPVLWRVFGTTVLSIAALIAITLYNQVSAGLNELRNDLNHCNASQGELVKKDEFNGRIQELNGRTTAAWNSTKEVQASQATSLAQRAAALEQEVKAGEDERKELARDLQRLRERLAALDGRLTALPVPSAGPRPPSR